MNRFRAVAIFAVLAGGLGARAESQEWKAARVWVSGGDGHVWVVAASEAKGTALSNVQFWYSPVHEGEAIQLRQRLLLPPVAGNPVAVAADAGGLRVLFSDLTTCDYFFKRPFSPGANWLEQCRSAPLAWCGDASEPMLWALVETEALAPPTTQADEDGIAASPPTEEEIQERLTVLRLRDGLWQRTAGPPSAEAGRRFWITARAGDLFLFWDDGKQIRISTLEHDQWSEPEAVLKGESIRHAWAGTHAGGPVFIAGRKKSDAAAQIEVYQRRDGVWSMTGRLREGNEFLSIDPRAAALGVAGGQIVVARRTAKGQVEAGASDLEGVRPVRFETLSLQREQPPAASDWQDAMVLGLVLGVMTLVLWKRRDQVAAPIMLPPGLVPAAVWRRALATALDFAPAFLLMMPWWLKVMPETAHYGDLQTLLQQSEDPELQAKIAPVQYTTILVYGLWCMVWEMLIGTTPGKYLFGCRVMSILGGRPSPRQAFVRNVARVIMVSMGAPGLIVTLMMIVIVTRNRQRVGDLMAGTIVVEPGVAPEEPSGQEPEERRDDGGGQ